MGQGREKGKRRKAIRYRCINQLSEKIHSYNGHEDIGSYSNTKCNDLKILSAKEGSLPIAIELGDQQYAPLISSHGHIIGLVEMETDNLADLSPLTMFGKDLSEKPLFCGKRHEEAALGIIDFGYRFYHPNQHSGLRKIP